jgi:hypothetical protein
MLLAGRSRFRFPKLLDFFFNLPNPSRRIVAFWMTQPLKEISTRNIPGGKAWPARKDYNLNAVCAKAA